MRDVPGDALLHDINIEVDLRNSMLMSYVSKRHTVPQIFFGEEHIGGAIELKSLSEEEIRNQANFALSASEAPSFLYDDYATLTELQAATFQREDTQEGLQEAMGTQ